MADTFLSGLVVAEIGDRQAVGSCGSLLADLGATVILAEALGAQRTRGTKWQHRAALAAGKRRAAFDPSVPADLDTLRRVIATSDVVLTSSDMQPECMSAAVSRAGTAAIVCDISAFGTDGPLAGRDHSDFLIQALCGAMDTTGAPENPPTPTQVPVMELMAAVYATAGVLAVLRGRGAHGASQRVEIALFDCAVTTLTTFLPGYFTGQEPQRIGNHHPSMSPWNAFPTCDGWVLLCSGSDDQWRRVCELIGRPELAAEPRYASPTSRVQVNAEVDAIVEQWTRTQTVAQCIERFNAARLACGPVYTLADLWTEPALAHRGMIRTVADAATAAEMRVPGSVFRGTLCSGLADTRVARIDEDRDLVRNLAQSRAIQPSRSVAGPVPRPLAGVRVIEIGNYTTAPLVARQLGALGADVVKVEPPGGDSSRALPPHRDGQSYFFTLSNCEKRSLMLDLRNASDQDAFRALLAQADVLVENLKPGSLARLGFGEREIQRLNPRLVYCPISGFGADSPYADRAAMDTTIQAMSGIMDLTRAAGIPYKTGISSADLAGGQFGLVAILAALDYRERTGRGQAIDLSMQDCAAWLTHPAWNRDAPAPGATLVRCDDGYVAADSPPATVAALLGNSTRTDAVDSFVGAAGMRREDVTRIVSGAGVPCAPVLRVTEVMAHPQTLARKLLVTGTAADGTQWPLLACPIGLSLSPPVVQRAIGALGADGAQVRDEWLERDARRRARAS